MTNHKPRRITSTVLSLMLVLSVLAVMNFTSMNVRADYDETIWWNGGYTVNATAVKTFPTDGKDSSLIIMRWGDLTIEDGYTLTFNDNVTFQIWNANETGEYGINIESGGEFVIDSTLTNTTIQTYPLAEENTYHFLNSGTIDFLGATVERVYGNPSDKANTGGIRNLPGSSCTLENCNIMDGDTHGLFFSGNSTNLSEVNLANVSIANTTSGVLSGSGIWIDGLTSIQVQNITINNTDRYGIEMYNSNNVTLTNNTRICNVGDLYGLYVENSTVLFENSSIEDCSSYGLYCRSNSNITVNNCIIENNGPMGIYIKENSNAIINNVTIQENGGFGVYIDNSNTVITNCNINNNTELFNQDDGIYVIGAIRLVIENNTIAYNGNHGIHLDSVLNCQILNNEIYNNTNSGISTETDCFVKSTTSTPSIDQYSNDTILLKLNKFYSKGGLREQTLSSIKSQFNCQVKKQYQRNDIIKLKLPQDVSVDQVIDLLEDDPRISYAEPDYKISLNNMPNELICLKNWLWGFHNAEGWNDTTYDADIDAPEAWDISTGNGSLIVAVIDTGIDYAHEDLESNIWINSIESVGDANYDGRPGINGTDDDNDGLTDEDGEGREPGDPGYDSSYAADDDENGYIDDIHGIDSWNGDSDPLDDNDHGTHCAGTIGAIPNNYNESSIGLNWNVSLMGLKCFANSGDGSVSSVIECLEYMIMMKEMGYNISVCSNSWAFSSYSESLYDAIAECRDSDILFVVSAGNNKKDSDVYYQYPSCFNLTNIISVTATDCNDSFASSFANYGKGTVDVAAPGETIFSTKRNSLYGYLSGTSMATPYVAGLVNLIKSNNASLNYINIKNIIMNSVDGLAPLDDLCVTNGRINANKSLHIESSGVNVNIPTPAYAPCGAPVDITVCVNDGISPITNATVIASFSNGDDDVILNDDGSLPDQVNWDGYYSGKWTPNKLGNVILNITALSSKGNVSTSHEINIIGIEVQYNQITCNGINGLEFGANTISYIIANNNISFNDYGVVLRSGCTLFNISRNVLESNINGIVMQEGAYNVVSENIIFNHTSNSSGEGRAITFESCHNNSISDNSFFNNTYALYFDSTSDDNIIYNNMIENNSIQASDNGTNNSWDNGYPSGGNYWSDYNGTDTQYGENQNYTGADGIGDTHYNSSYGQGIGGGSSEDNYPLSGPIIDGRFMKPSFRIDSDDDFTTKSWIAPTGNGTEENPWTIQRYYINGSGNGYCIYIGNTSEFYTIEDCVLYNASGQSEAYYWNAGISLYNTTNGTINENLIYNNSKSGIYCSYPGLAISNETVYGPTWGYGNDPSTIELDHDDILDCTLYLNFNGTEWYKMNETDGDYEIDNETGEIYIEWYERFEDNWTFYAYYNYSDILGNDTMPSLVIFNNVIASNLDDGINSFRGNVSIMNNTISENIGSGIWMEYCTGEISNNTITENHQSSGGGGPPQMSGIDLFDCQSIQISHNNISENHVNIYVVDSENITIERNEMLDENAIPYTGAPTPRGIYSISSQIIASNNTIWGTCFGIDLEDADNETILADNKFYRIDSLNPSTGTEIGIRLIEASPILERNLFDEIKDGIKCYGNSSAYIHNNTIINCTYDGIYLEWSEAIIIGNNISGNGGWGVLSKYAAPQNAGTNGTGLISDNPLIGSNGLGMVTQIWTLKILVINSTTNASVPWQYVQVDDRYNSTVWIGYTDNLGHTEYIDVSQYGIINSTITWIYTPFQVYTEYPGTPTVGIVEINTIMTVYMD